MKLIQLDVTNFRQHAETRVRFQPGLTGIIGPNGSGKTTLLEAIAWAIYGATAVRGTNDTLRFNRAEGRTAVSAELVFELSGERYRVLRTPRRAELYLGAGESPIAAGVTEVTRQLTRRLGMTRDEFFNTYFTGQKELQFLASMGPTDRARFLARVLGYERLRTAQKLVRERRNALRGEIETLREALGDREAPRLVREAAEARAAEAESALEAAEREETGAAARFGEVEPGWLEVQKAREGDAAIESDLRLARERLENARARERETGAELERLKEVSTELDDLRKRVEPLADVERRCEELGRLADAVERRKGLERDLERVRKQVAELSEEAGKLEKAAADADELEREAARLESEQERLAGARDAAREGWQRDRQDIDAQLRMRRDAAAELKRQIEDLKKAGPDGTCPTCERPLGDEYDRVLGEVTERYDEVVADGQWLKSRAKQLESEPDEVAQADRRLAEAREASEKARERLAAARAAADQARSLRARLEAEEARARELAGELAALPEDYDREEHEKARARLEELREMERRATRLETRLEARDRLVRERGEAEEAVSQLSGRLEELESQRAELGFSAERYEEAKAAYDEARESLQTARIRAERARGELEAARESLEAARRAEEEDRKRRGLVRERSTDLRLHNDLDAALDELRRDLNERVRPELSEIASIFIAELTDGRYNQIEITDDYEVVVLDDGEEKPVISGGEEDLANLVLRLAISQMIADRAGQSLSLLIFDEVFGGLDELRREGVIRLLQRLQDRFEQVILITHIESIREGMDQVIRVGYDERSGASVAREESPGATVEDLEVEDLAPVAGG